jgi:hypothetical protein
VLLCEGEGVPGYLEPDACGRLLAEVDSQPWHDVGGQRRIQFYGYWSEFRKVLDPLVDDAAAD